MLASTETRLGSTRAELIATSHAQDHAHRHLDNVQSDDSFTRTILYQVNQNLADVAQTDFFEGLDITNLQTCLGGVKGAVGHIAAHDNSQAGMDLSGVAQSCESVDGGNTDGLVYPFDFPDPFVLTVGTTTYAYATNSVEGNIQIIESHDLTHWTAVGNALPKLAGWAAPNDTWAPAVLPIGGHYVLYYTALMAKGGPQCISAATASTPEGPFIDTSPSPFDCQPALGGSIDPSPFIDANGTPYLVWKSTGTGSQASTIWSQQLDPSGTSLVGAAATALLSPSQTWEGATVEAPDLYENSGRYFLFLLGQRLE